DMKKEEISINIWQRQYWYDNRLAWKPSEHENIIQLGVFLKEIWTPDIYLYYSSGKVNKFGKDFPGGLPFSAQISSSGVLFFSQPTTIYAPCEVDVGFYPFDDQICKLTFGTWSQDASVVRMLLYEGGFDMTSYLNHNEWEIVSVKPSTQTVQLGSSENGHAIVVYTIHLRRHALFYMINYILPSIIIAILSLLLFLIPPEVGKRMEAGINLLLCLSVYLMLVNSKMPLSSKSFPLLTKFYGCTIMILVVSLCCSCWVYSYYFMNPSGWDIYHLPSLLEKVIFNFLGPALNLPRKSRPLQHSSNPCNIDVKGHENQALDENQIYGLELKGAAEANTDQSKSEKRLTQSSSSLVDEAVSVDNKEQERELSKEECSAVKDACDSGHDEEKAVKSSLVDETLSVNDTIKKEGNRREEECSTVACDSNHGEEEDRSSLDPSMKKKKKKKTKKNLQKKEEECSTVVCESNHGEEEDGSSLDPSMKKKKKTKKKKKNASKIIQRTIAVKRITGSFDQHIKESSRGQDDGDDNRNNGQDKNLREEEHATETLFSELTVVTPVPSDFPPGQDRHLLYLAQSSKQKDQKFENTERWKLAAIILDRFFSILLVLSIVVSFLACFLSSPRVRMGLI
ncbi:neuronal acetylcholine receptor subunit alpha-6-like, partial [Actinia tenebrosa]|uniref:Neuronal acetylcholine receptor subunit alpha-6-like n=1 Tax=Actinia tenebrosa TaxID=6105 RepID=A0A6P8J0V1_ACTTE